MKPFTQHSFPDHQLPLILQPSDPHVSLGKFLDQLEEQREDIKRHLLNQGGVLFRNFPIHGHDDFGSVIDRLALGTAVNYIGGDSPRKKVKGPIYTSTEAPPSIAIPLHNELSFVNHYPKHIYFYCAVATSEGGQTTVADARQVFKAVDPAVRKRFEEKGIKYTSRYYHQSKIMDLLNRLQPSHKTWLDVFETNDKKEVERLCHKHEFGYRWHQNDWLEISQVRPATMKHPSTQENVWFNQSHLFDFSPKLLGWWRYIGAKAFYCRKHTLLHEVAYADGSPIPRDELYHVMDVLDANTIRFQWQPGDVLVLDNVLSMHGRAPFKGKRRILAAMTG